MDKWYYIKQISIVSNKYGDLLLDMLNHYDKLGLKDITYREAKHYWEQLNKNN